jgi:hypothetical protein
LSTSFSNVCRSDANYLSENIAFSDCSTVLTNNLMTDVSPTGQPVYNPAPDDSAPWRRSYAGILAAYASGNKIIGIVHGENQNVHVGDTTYLNTVKDVVDPNCAAGYDAHGVWQNCWSQFASFANLVWWNKNDFFNGKPPHDTGPVVWNHLVYAQDGSGPYHPTLFSNGSFAYLYSVENPSQGWPCLTAARARINLNGLPGAFSSLAGDGTFSLSGLPQGFSLSAIRDFYTETVTEPACLFDATYSGTWFSVARLADTPYYLSLEERYLHSPDAAQVVLRISDDPGNWKQSSEIVLEQKSGGWGALTLSYPMFSDADATQLGVVAPTSFFVVGNNPRGGYGLHALPLSVRLP